MTCCWQLCSYLFGSPSTATETTKYSLYSASFLTAGLEARSCFCASTLVTAGAGGVRLSGYPSSLSWAAPFGTKVQLNWWSRWIDDLGRNSKIADYNRTSHTHLSPKKSLRLHCNIIILWKQTWLALTQSVHFIPFLSILHYILYIKDDCKLQHHYLDEAHEAVNIICDWNPPGMEPNRRSYLVILGRRTS